MFKNGKNMIFKDSLVFIDDIINVENINLK
jgi:hypothetical protein